MRVFSYRLMDNILELHNDLVNHTYKHGGYQAFNICDPKPRNIHKASVREGKGGVELGVGLPLGNLTSQLFVNIYLNEFDQFVKHKLKAKYYIRYCDDFVILSQDRNRLALLILVMKNFLAERLGLELHPDKVFIKTIASGVDFLGWVNFPKHRVLRTATRLRMLKKIMESPREQTLQSYLGLLKHGNTYRLERELLNHYWLWYN